MFKRTRIPLGDVQIMGYAVVIDGHDCPVENLKVLIEREGSDPHHIRLFVVKKRFRKKGPLDVGQRTPLTPGGHVGPLHEGWGSQVASEKSADQQSESPESTESHGADQGTTEV